MQTDPFNLWTDRHDGLTGLAAGSPSGMLRWHRLVSRLGQVKAVDPVAAGLDVLGRPLQRSPVDGTVARSPATIPGHRYEVRTTDGIVEVRLAAD